MHELPQSRRSNVSVIVFSPQRCCIGSPFSLLHACLPVSIVRLPVPFVKLTSFILPGVPPKRTVPSAQKVLSHRCSVFLSSKHFCHQRLFGFQSEDADVLVCVNLCLFYGGKCVRVCVDACASVLWDAAGSCAWSGDVMMSRGFFVSLLFLFFSLLGQPAGLQFEVSVIFMTTKTSKIGGFL